MGSAIWYKKRNDGGTKEGEKLRKRNDGEGTVFADGIKRRRENHPRRKKKKAREIDSANNSRLHHWFCHSSFLTCHSYIVQDASSKYFTLSIWKERKWKIYLRWLILNTIEKLRRNDKLLNNKFVGTSFGLEQAQASKVEIVGAFFSAATLRRYTICYTESDSRCTLWFAVPSLPPPRLSCIICYIDSKNSFPYCTMSRSFVLTALWLGTRNYYSYY